MLGQRDGELCANGFTLVVAIGAPGQHRQLPAQACESEQNAIAVFVVPRFRYRAEGRLADETRRGTSTRARAAAHGREFVRCEANQFRSCAAPRHAITLKFRQERRSTSFSTEILLDTRGRSQSVP